MLHNLRAQDRGRDNGAYGLTQKQLDLARFIAERIKRTGVSPSYDEMKAALGLESKSGIHRLVDALEKRGMIRRRPNMARSINMTDAYRSSVAATDLDLLIERVGIKSATEMMENYLEMGP